MISFNITGCNIKLLAVFGQFRNHLQFRSVILNPVPTTNWIILFR